MEETAATGLDPRTSSNGHGAWGSASTTASTPTSRASRGQISTAASSPAPAMPPEKRRRQDEPEHQHQQHQHHQQIVQGGVAGGPIQHQHQQPQSPHQWQSQQYTQAVLGLAERNRRTFLQPLRSPQQDYQQQHYHRLASITQLPLMVGAPGQVMSPVMMTSGDASGSIGCRVRSSRSSSISPDLIAQQNHVLRHAVSNVTAEKLQLQAQIMELQAHEAARVTQLGTLQNR